MSRSRSGGRVTIKTRFALRKPFLTGLLRPSAFQKPAWISPPEWKSMELVPANGVPSVTPGRLANLLDFYGSNKASKHDYQYPLSFAFNVAPAGARLSSVLPLRVLTGQRTDQLVLTSTSGLRYVPLLIWDVSQTSLAQTTIHDSSSDPNNLRRFAWTNTTSNPCACACNRRMRCLQVELR